MRITILSDSPFIPTGYSNQAKQLADYLSRQGHEIHFLANSYQGATLKKAVLTDDTTFNYKIYGQKQLPYFQDLISYHLKETNSDVFLVLLDTFMLHGGNAWFLNVDTSPAKTYFWFPSDGGVGMPLDCERILQKVDVPVAMSKFGKKQVFDYHRINAEYIPHGLNVNRFSRLPDNDREILKSKYNLNGKFVIGVVSRNQPRKFLDRTMKAMSIIKDRIPNAMLLMHLDPSDQAAQFNMAKMISRYNLENRVVFTGMTALKGWDWDKMNEVYNTMDVLLSTTSGEGFGICTIEAMACEVPVAITDYTTTQELVTDNQAGLPIKLTGTEQVNMFDMNMKDYDNKTMEGTITGSWMVERGLCSVEDAVNKIEYLWHNPNAIKRLGANGRKAVLEQYDFENIVGPAWNELITK